MYGTYGVVVVAPVSMSRLILRNVYVSTGNIDTYVSMFPLYTGSFFHSLEVRTNV